MLGHDEQNERGREGAHASGILQEIRALYDANRYLDAHARALELGPYAELRDVRARIMAGRLLMQLGARRRGTALHFYTYRKHPHDAEACYFYASSCKSRSPYMLLEFVRRRGAPADASPETASHWAAMEATALAELRDFDRAYAALERAKRIHLDPWLLVEEADVLATEDRREQALEVAREALRMQPDYRPAVQVCAGLLAELDQLDAAIALLAEAASRAQCGPFLLHLAHYQSEAGSYREALESSRRAEALMPLTEPEDRESQHARMAELAYLAGDHALARELAQSASTPGAERLARDVARDGRRVQVPVKFVRQHHMTCAPATLASITAHWNRAIDHTALAAEICYGGTSDHGEREWAERNGFATKEFRVTLESTRALIDRGIAFTLTTLEPTSGHLQAVIGYDSRRSSVLVRDPSLRHFVEYDAEILQHYRACGPRGMALVPRERAELLQTLELPESELYDRLFELQRALQGHRRDAAADALARMESAAAGHRLTLEAQDRLARYDQDGVRRLRSAEALLALFPDDARIAFAKFAAMRDLSSSADTGAFLAEWTRKKQVVPALWQAHADHLRYDPRRQLAARTLLRSAIRHVAGDGASYHILADTLWSVRRFADAVELYRLAACLQDTNEHYAIAYFRAARFVKDMPAALAFLERRVQRHGARSSAPAITFFTACEELDHPDQGFAALARALTQRPNDGELLLFAAQAEARYGRFERAGELLARAEPNARAVDRLAAAARVASYRGAPADALAQWQRIAELEPLNLEAHGEVARGLSAARGVPAALEHLHAAARRFPHHIGLARLLYDWEKRRGGSGAENALRALIELIPDEPWAHRELAFLLLEHGRSAEAWQALEATEALGDDSAARFGLRAQLCFRSQRVSEAQDAYRKALERGIDYTYAIEQLIATCSTLEERRAALDFVKRELIRQVTHGPALLAFRAEARAILPDDEVLATMQEAQRERPDLPEAWFALCREHVARSELDDALRWAEGATERFPFRSDAWLLLAHVHELRQMPDAERAALDRGRELLPNANDLARELARSLIERAQPGAARALLDNALGRDPLDARTHGVLALCSWHEGERQAALERLSHCVALDPEYTWAWDRLREWARKAEDEDAVLRCARALCEQRPGEVHSFIMLAEVLAEREQHAECLGALERAVALDPQCEEAYDLRARVLVQERRYHEAARACEPEAWPGRPPRILLGRRAWVDAEQGRVQDAIARMRAVVADSPDYLWGWSRLADWCGSCGDVAGHLQATGQLVRLQPHHAAAHGYHAEALLQSGDRAGAKLHFERAIGIDPDYFFGAAWLFDLALEDGEHDTARRALACLQRERGELTLAREVALAVAQKRWDEARVAFAALARLVPEGDWAHGHALAALDGAGRGADVDAVLIEVLGDAAAPAGAASSWIARRRGALGRALREASRVTLGPAGTSAVARIIEQAFESGKAPASAFWRLFWHRRWLSRHTETWGAVGYAYVRNAHWRRGSAWMRSYERMPDVKPWMLHNLAATHRQLGRDAAALAVHRAALRLDADHTRPHHVLWTALDDALHGAQEAARAALHGVDPKGLTRSQMFLRELIKVTLWAARTRDASYRQLYSVRLRLIDLDRRTGSVHAHDRALWRARRATLSALARGRSLMQALWIRVIW